MNFIFLITLCFHLNSLCSSKVEWVIFEKNNDQMSLELDKKFLETELFKTIKQNSNDTRPPKNKNDDKTDKNHDGAEESIVKLAHLDFDDIKMFNRNYQKNLTEWNFEDYIGALNVYDTGSDIENFLYNYYQKVSYFDLTQKMSDQTFSDVEKIYRRILLSIRKTDTNELRSNTLKTIENKINSNYLKSHLHDFILFTIAKKNPRNFAQNFLNSCEQIDLSWLSNHDINEKNIENVQQFGNWQCVTLNNNQRKGSFWFGLKNVENSPGIVLYNQEKKLFFLTNRY